MNSALVSKTLGRLFTNFEHAQLQKEIEALRSQPHFSSQRMAGYFEMKLAYRNGEFSKCIEIIERTKESYGAHLTLLAMKAWAHFHLGQMVELRLQIQEILKTLEATTPLLSSDTYIRVVFSLGMLLEVEGDIATALSFYKKCESIDLSDIPIERVYSIKAQILRAQAEFNHAREDSNLRYLELMRTQGSHPTLYHHQSVQHALMLYEAMWLNPKQATQRLESLLADPKLNAEDRALNFYDLLEIALLKNFKFEWSSPIPKPSSRFQKWLLDFWKNSSLLEIPITTELSTAQRIKIESLVLRKKPSETPMSIHSVGRASQKIWVNRDGSQKSADFEKFEVTLTPNGKLYFGEEDQEKLVDLSRQAQLLRILELISSRESALISYDQIADVLWSTPYGVHLHDRMRNMALRLNKSLGSIIGAESWIRARKEGYEIDPRLKIRLAP